MPAKPIVNLRGLDALIARANALAVGGLDARDLMVTFQRIIEEDNRKGVLAGTDKDGSYMIGVTYRPVGKPKRLTAAQRNGAKGNRKKGTFGGFGPMAAGLHNNLTTSEYRRLAGPPLAPRGKFSRAITNLETDSDQVGPHEWLAFGFWRDVVDAKGRPFLHYHFNGSGRNPVRDLRGVRPEGREKARKAAVAWLSDRIRRLKDPGFQAA